MRYAAALILAACSNAPSVELGAIVEEPGRVIALHHMPGWHGTQVEQSLLPWLDNTEIRTSVPARYTTVLACEHGTFTMEGREPFMSLSLGEDVTLGFRTVYVNGKLVDVRCVSAVGVGR